MRIQWTIVVTAETGDEGEAVQRLKGLLKVALRRFGMRCTSVSETWVVTSAVRGEVSGMDCGAGFGDRCGRMAINGR